VASPAHRGEGEAGAASRTAPDAAHPGTASPDPVLGAGARDRLERLFSEAARRGALGPGAVADAIDHAAGFAAVLRPAGHILDLGSGAGLPGLVLSELLPAARLTLVEARYGRADALRRAVGRCGFGDRVAVLAERAERLGHDPAWRGALDAVVARGFGPPLVTAECAAPFLRLGGQLVVSEPPPLERSRWPERGLAALGLCRDPVPGLYASFTQVTLCPEPFARRRPGSTPMTVGST
jgi:16S rRNA (guanine527-N7)-methyltransferase